MKRNKKNTKLVLILLLLCITLGYAALRTGLNINGTTNVSSASWNVHFENYQMSNATNITPTTEPVIVGTTTTSISYEVDLVQPGDLYEFSVEVVNGGSIDANISLVYKYNGSEIDNEHTTPAYIDYVVSDENGDPIVDNHRLNHGERETIKVFVKYKDTDPSILPSSSTTLSFDIEIEATQAEKETPTEDGPFTLSLANRSEDYTQIGQAIPNNVSIYTSVSAAMNAWTPLLILEHPSPYFLKHTLNSNDNISESYVAFVIPQEAVIDDPKVTPGVYYLKGGDNGVAYHDNQNTIITAFGIAPDEFSPTCWVTEEETICSTLATGTPGVSIYSDGKARAYSYDGSQNSFCYIETNGDSYCDYG